MKNKNIFKIYFILLVICIFSLTILFIFGNKSRKGYLSNFVFNEEHINKTLELNGFNISETKNLFIKTGQLDNDALINYVFTNEAIRSYSYGFRIKYYSKIFRNSDIYGVYIDSNKAIKDNNFIIDIQIDEKGSPFGNIISTKKLNNEDNIGNITYTLKLKPKFIIIFILSLLILLLIINLIYKYGCKIYNYFIKIYNLFFIPINYISKYIVKYRKNILYIYSVLIVIIFVLLLSLNFLSKNYRIGTLGNFELTAETPAGYVYKANIFSKGFFSDNFIFKYSKDPLKVENKPSYVKNYGYSYILNTKPHFSDWNQGTNWNNDDGTFTVSNSSSWNNYHYNILLSTGERYNILMEAKRMNPTSNDIQIGFSISYFISEYTSLSLHYISNSVNSIDYAIYGTDEYIYDAVHTESILQFYFPPEELNIKYIKIEQVNENAFYVKDNSYVIFTSSSNVKPNTNDFNIYYKLSFNQYFINIIILIFIIYLTFLIFYIIYNNNLNCDAENTKNISYSISRNDILFLSILTFLSIFLFIFQFWLFFPGYFQYWDTWFSIVESIDGIYSNQSGVIIPLSLHILYKIFGYNNYYLLFINLFLFSSSLYLIVFSLYIKYRKKLLIILLLITFIPNFFFLNFNHIKDVTSSLFLFFSISLIFFKINIEIKNKKLNIFIMILSMICSLIAMLWRHNFIVTVYPIFLLYTFILLKNNNKIKYLIKFCFIMFIFAIILILIHYSFPRFFIKEEKLLSKYGTQHLFLLQVASCAVPNNDNSLINDDWYLKNKNFENLKDVYNLNPLFGDQLTSYVHPQRIFKYAIKSEGLKKVWIKYIFKYPKSYISHCINSANSLWNSYIWKIDSASIQSKNDKGGITFSPLKEKIYSFLYNFIPNIKTIYFVGISIILFIISGILWFIKYNYRSALLLFCFSTSFSAFATALISALFIPAILYRYIHPVTYITVASLISFIVFLCDILSQNISNKK